jgi:hypothetical protein
VLLLGAMAGLAALRRIVAWLGGDGDPEWYATPPALCWVMLPFAGAGLWNWGLGAIAAYAGATCGWTLMRALRLAR